MSQSPENKAISTGVLSVSDEPHTVGGPDSPWQQMEGDTAKLVGDLLMASARETAQIQDRLIESYRSDAIQMANDFLALYRLVANDQNLPRYTERWVFQFDAAADAAERMVEQAGN